MTELATDSGATPEPTTQECIDWMVVQIDQVKAIAEALPLNYKSRKHFETTLRYYRRVLSLLLELRASAAAPGLPGITTPATPSQE